MSKIQYFDEVPMCFKTFKSILYILCSTINFDKKWFLTSDKFSRLIRCNKNAIYLYDRYEFNEILRISLDYIFMPFGLEITCMNNQKSLILTTGYDIDRFNLWSELPYLLARNEL